MPVSFIDGTSIDTCHFRFRWKNAEFIVNSVEDCGMVNPLFFIEFTFKSNLYQKMTFFKTLEMFSVQLLFKNYVDSISSNCMESHAFISVAIVSYALN